MSTPYIDGTVLTAARLNAAIPEFPAASFGPVGASESSTQNRQTIQAACDAAEAAGGGVVVLPPGVLEIDQMIARASNVEIRGAGMYATTLRGQLGTALVGVAEPAYAAEPVYAGGGVSRLTLDGVSSAESGQVGLDLSQCYDATIVQVRAINCEAGFMVANNAPWNTLVDCVATDCVSGFVLTNGANSTRLFGCRASDVVLGFAVVSGDDDGNIGVLIQGCEVDTATVGFGITNVAGLGLAQTSDITISDCRLINLTIGVNLEESPARVALLRPYLSSVTNETNGTLPTSFESRWSGRDIRGVRIPLRDDYGGTAGHLLYRDDTTGYAKFRNSTDAAHIGIEAALVSIGSGGILIQAGSGSPESVVTAPVGSLYLRTDSATTLYVKQTGTGNTGWVAK